MIVTEHVFVTGNPRCIYCGAAESHKGSPDSMCVPRVTGNPDPVRREAGVYDAEVISARIAELRAERQEALNRPSEEPPEGGELGDRLVW